MQIAVLAVLGSVLCGCFYMLGYLHAQRIEIREMAERIRVNGERIAKLRP